MIQALQFRPFLSTRKLLPAGNELFGAGNGKLRTARKAQLELSYSDRAQPPLWRGTGLNIAATKVKIELREGATPYWQYIPRSVADARRKP